MSSGEKMPQNAGENQIKEDSKEIGKRVVDTLNKESIHAEFDKQLEDSKRIRDAFSNIDGKGNFGLGDLPYANFEEEGFSGFLCWFDLKKKMDQKQS